MKLKLINPRNIILVVAITFQAIWNIKLLAIRFLAAAGNSVFNLDFLVYYSAGYISRFISAQRVYDLSLQKQIQETIVPISGYIFNPYNHPPLFNALLSWAVNGNYSDSYFRWVSILFIILIFSLGIILLLLQSLHWGKKEILIICFSGALFYPVVASFIRGQDSTFLLLGIVLWTYGLITNRDKVAGLGLALTIIRPQIALVLAIPFIFKRRNVWWWFLLWGVVLLTYCWSMIGTNGLVDFVRVLIFTGQGTSFGVDIMPTFMGAIYRIYPSINTILLLLIECSLYILTIICLSAWWAKSKSIGFTQIGIAILLAIFSAPHLHNHDLMLLFIPALAAVDSLTKSTGITLRNLVLVPLIISIFLTISDFISGYFLIYFIYLFLAFMLFLPEEKLFFQRIFQRNKN